MVEARHFNHMDGTMTPAEDTYKSIAAPGKGSYRDLGSRFLAFAYPVETADQVKEIVADLKKEYFDARHHCYAYRLGKDGEQWRANDDGETSSSAGRPILGQLLSNELSDVLVVVVRYFGGTKLGIPGLIKAYRSATADALADCAVIEKVATEPLVFEFGYLQMNDVMKFLKDRGLTPESQEFDLTCRITLQVPVSQVSSVCADIPATLVV